MKKLIAMMMFIALVCAAFLAASAQDNKDEKTKPEENRSKLHITAQVVDDIGISAKDIVAGAKKFFGKRGIEVVDESDEGVTELFVTVGRDDADDDNDQVEDAKDNDDDGDKIEDSSEKIEAFDLYDRLPCDMISAYPDQNKREGVYVIISGADQAESIRFNSFVDTFSGGTDEMADDDVFQFHLFYPAIEQGFIQLPKDESAMTNRFTGYFQTVSFNWQDSVPKMVFEAETIDYGKIKEGAEPYRVFKFKNVGDRELIITSARGADAPCRHTRKNPLSPASRGKLRFVTTPKESDFSPRTSP